MLIMQRDIPQSNVSIVERLVIHQNFAERRGKVERHILWKKNQKKIFRKIPNEGFPIGNFKSFNALSVRETKDKGSSIYNSKNNIGKHLFVLFALNWKFA
jgi:hypothetical protein